MGFDLKVGSREWEIPLSFMAMKFFHRDYLLALVFLIENFHRCVCVSAHSNALLSLQEKYNQGKSLKPKPRL